jgi:predicted metal-dependent phosphoesterase TrpH
MEDNSGRVDLHIHTTFSDGDMTPEEMVADAQKAGLAGIAITDHDEVEGVRAAREAAAGSDFIIVPGVELSTSDGKNDIHILGYLIDINSSELRKYLDIFRDARLNRGIHMVERLREMGVDIEVDSVLDIAGGGAVGRPHIAAALLQNGCVDSTEDAFRKYIGFNSPAYVPKYQLKPSDAFRLIREAGGVGVMSHPGTTRKDELITEFIGCGMRGIEVYHPKHSESEAARYKRLAEKLGLVVTGGSDSHGRRNARLHVGARSVPVSAIDQLEKARSY